MKSEYVINPFPIFQAILIMMKLSREIDWSWWIVLLPMILPVAFILFCLFFLFIFYLVIFIRIKRRLEDKMNKDDR